MTRYVSAWQAWLKKIFLERFGGAKKKVLKLEIFTFCPLLMKQSRKPIPSISTSSTNVMIIIFGDFSSFSAKMNFLIQ
jgi:hypothetical protein